MAQIEIDGDYVQKNTSRRSQFESNCQQVFARGPNLTKELFNKVQAEVSAQESSLCGLQCKTKHVWGTYHYYYYSSSIYIKITFILRKLLITKYLAN